MLKVFKTFVATVALSQKIILLLDEVPSLQLSPSLSHWNIGKLGKEEESCSGLRVVVGITNRFFPSFFSFSLPSKSVYSKSKRAMWGKSKCIYRGQHHEQKMRERFLFCPAEQPRPNHRFTQHSQPFLTFLGNPTELKIPGKPLLSCEFLMVGIENNFPSASELSQRGPRPSLFTRIAR